MTVEIEPWDADLAPEPPEEVCDGAGDEGLEAIGSTPRSRGWGSGWPDCQTNQLVTIKVSPVRLSVRREIAPLIAWLSQQTIQRGYEFRSGQCWGFACRSIRGSTTPSNHSWGLAVDINSLANPMGPTLKTDMPSWMPKLWTDHGFRWGGTYTTRKDAMHYEYMGTPNDAARTIAALGAAAPMVVAARAVPRTQGAVAAPAPAYPLPSEHYFGQGAAPRCHDGRVAADATHIRTFQKRMIERGWDLGSPGADGRFGPKVDKAVTGFQKEKGLEVDGIVGPVTWRAIWEARVT